MSTDPNSPVKMPDLVKVGGTLGNPSPKLNLTLTGTGAALLKGLGGQIGGGQAKGIMQGLGGILGGQSASKTSTNNATTNAAPTTNAPATNAAPTLNQLWNTFKPR
jgi:hypothetical protein